MSAAPLRAARSAAIASGTCLALAAAAGAAAGQQPAPATMPQAAARGTATVVAGPEYAAGPLKRRLLGSHYRDAWTTPARFPVLDLQRFAGGLTPTKLGGGNQTRSLRFKGADGRTYAFRSVDKDVTKALPRDLQNTVVDQLIQDQTRAQLPGSVVAVQVLEEAAGVAYIPAQLYVMPDDPALGEYRAMFAGMLGDLEEHPGGDDDPPFRGTTHVENSDRFEAALLSGPEERLDDRDYLNVRLFDLFLNDWDRHEDQYHWLRYDRPGGGHLWRALPGDRDWALDDFDGILMGAARAFTPKIVTLDARYPRDLTGLILNAQFLDRRLLGELPRPAWDSAALALKARLDDAAIDRAVAALPAEYGRLYGPYLAGRLRARRDSLPEVAGRFYRLLAEEAEVNATRKADFAEAVRRPDGSLDVTLALRGADGAAAGEPYFHRRYLPSETREVRLFLHAGDDRFVDRGVGSGIRVRVVPDSGADVLQSTGSGPLTLYTRDAADTISAGPGVEVQRHSWNPEKWKRGDPTAAVPRDWGAKFIPLSTVVGVRRGVGPVVGLSAHAKRWAFRHDPYASTQSLTALYAPLYTRFGLEYTGEFHLESVRTRVDVNARLSDFEVERFYGFGNETAQPEREVRIWERGLTAQARLTLPLARRLFLSAGPAVRWLKPEVEGGTVLAAERPRGTTAYTAAGAGADLTLAARDSTALPRHGLVFTLGGSAFPYAHGGGVGSYGDAHGLARAYLSPAGRWAPTLALRAGGRRAWGSFPFQDAAAVGGWGTLRGYANQRFTGDAAAWGSAEARVPVMRANLGVRGDLGLLGLADAARVWMGGASPGGWHAAYGAGAWFSFLDHSHTATAAWARGETDKLYLRVEIPF